MKKNMGGMDKILRLLVGIVILILGYLYESWWGLIGLIPLLTSFTGFCPFYVPLKITTQKSKND